jgi:L-alanine-DL-glutamate epimerase-like enolase superfamily enzyme
MYSRSSIRFEDACPQHRTFGHSLTVVIPCCVARYSRAGASRMPGGPVTGLWSAFQVYEPGPALKAALKFLERWHKQLGGDVGLIYDVHRRATANQAVQFAKDVEHLKLVYLMDP